MPRIVVLGAGFGGLELSTILSRSVGEGLDLTLIDKSDTFVFGYKKLDMIFGHTAPEAIHAPYRNLVKPGVSFRQEAITAIDPEARRVTTDRGVYNADALVVALGADYDMGATPGLAEGGDEFYSVAGAERLTRKLPSFSKGRVVIGVAEAPFKCPPAPTEAAFMMHDYLTTRGVRGNCEIDVVIPFKNPIPPSPDTSRAILAAFEECGIRYHASRAPRELDPARRVVILDDDTELPYDLFLGVPKHRVPDVVAASGLAENGWISVDPATVETRFPGVYAIGDVAKVGAPKSGVFAENAARVVAESLLHQFWGGPPPAPFSGVGACYIEFGGGRVARVDIDFQSGPSPTGTYTPPSIDLVREKQQFGASRLSRWFGL